MLDYREAGRSPLHPNAVRAGLLGSGLLVQLQDSAVLPDEGQAVALVVGVHGAADDGVGVVDVLLQVIDPVCDMGVAVQHLREGGALLKFQVLDLVIIVIDVADPKAGASLWTMPGFLLVTGMPMCMYSADIVVPS